jgi:hypothetical protein
MDLLRGVVNRATVAFPRAAARLGRSWIDVRDAGDAVTREEHGVVCDFLESRRVRFAEHPSWGARLMRNALAQWPIAFASAPKVAGTCRITFVLGHRGSARIPHLLTSIATIAAQDVPLECIVVEQSVESEARAHLPPWVRYVHTPCAGAAAPYERSWALNVGARAARGDVLVLMDNDLCLPRAFASEVWRVLASFDAARLHRFVFYLDDATSRAVMQTRSFDVRPALTHVLQNSVGGVTAIRTSAYAAIGGHDERFAGWGGEDIEFYDRCRTLRFQEQAYLPVVHLHHPASRTISPTMADYFITRRAVSAVERAAELMAAPWGAVDRSAIKREERAASRSTVAPIG